MDDTAVRIQTLGRRLALLEQRTADETAAIRAELAELQGVEPVAPVVTPVVTPSVVRRKRTPIDLSWFEGPTGLAIAGGVVTLLGIVFVFALAASRGWIGPAVRCSIGGGVSIVLLGVAVLVRQRLGHVIAGLAAAGVGIGGLYITLYAASRGYHLIGPEPVWAGVVLVAALAVSLGVLWETQLLAVFGLAAVVIAPPTVEGHLTALGLAASAVASAAAVGLGAQRRWRALGGLSYALLLAQIALYVVDARGHFFGEGSYAVVTWHHRGTAATLAIVVGTIALVGAAGYGRGVQKVENLTGLLATSTLPLALLSVWALLEGSGQRGAAFIALAVAYFVSSVGASRLQQRELGVVLLAFALFTVALGTAFLLSNGSLVVAWTLEGVTFLALARELNRPTFQAAGLAYLVVAGTHLFIFETPLSRLFTEQAHPAQHLDLLVLFVAGIVGAAILLHGRPLVAARVDSAAAGAAALLAIYAGSLMLLDLSQRLGGGEPHAKFQRGETMVSALWALAALGLLAAGLSRGAKELRYAGLSLLALALAKLFLFDLSQLSSLARAASFLTVGITLLAGGFLVQRLARPRNFGT